EADAVIAKPVHFLPGFEVLRIGTNRDVRLEVAVGERIRQLAADLEMIELFAIGEQVKNENLHGVLPRGASARGKLFTEVTATPHLAPRRGKKFYICGNISMRLK